VTLTSLPEDEVKKFRQSARDEWSRWRERSPQAKEAVDSIQGYLQDKGML